MSTSQNPEEIDILQFFSAIGAFFKGIFNSITNLFKSLFFLFLDFLLYLKKNWIYLGIGLLLGLAFSFLGKSEQSEVYKGTATIRTNFGAQIALQEKLNVLNDLIGAKKYAQVAQLLGIEENEAQHLLGFDLEPVLNDVLLIDEYEDYLMSKDTVVYKFIEYKDYKKNIQNEPSLNIYWNVSINADQPDIFGKFNSALVTLLAKDADLIKRKKNYLFALNKNKEKTLKSLQDIDSMRTVFNKVMLELAQNKANAATNIVVSSDRVRGPETSYNLFYERTKALKNLEFISKKLNKFDDVVMMVDNFPNYGIKEQEVLNNLHFKYSIMGLLLALFFLLLKDFNMYLKKYQERKELKQS